MEVDSLLRVMYQPMVVVLLELQESLEMQGLVAELAQQEQQESAQRVLALLVLELVREQ